MQFYKEQGDYRYQTSPVVCNRTAHFAADTNTNLSPINAKLTMFSYVHASKSVEYLISANIHHYHSNNSFGDVNFGNSSH